jgi:broad specificity phosphatase PhoE
MQGELTMTETTLYLTRHGQTEWNLQSRMQGHKDSPLTTAGRQQAEWLGERLRQAQLDAVYSSTSPRAVQTAEIILGGRPLKLETLESLREINMGAWEGQQVDRIRETDPERYRNFWEKPHLYRPAEGGETYAALLDRTLPAILDIAARHSGGSVLIVTHRITLKAVMGHYLGKTLQELGELPDILSASLSKMVLRDGMPHVELYGDTLHYKEQEPH